LSFLPITRHAIAIQHPDIECYRIAIYVRISRFSGYRASGYQTLTVLLLGKDALTHLKGVITQVLFRRVHFSALKIYQTREIRTDKERHKTNLKI
jgi:hypothetical protein